MNIDQTPQLAHRIAFLLTHGTLPEAVCHACDTPGCCKPEHLWGGTRTDNNIDCINKGRDHKARGEAAGKAKFDVNTVRVIRKRIHAGEGFRALGREYGVHHKSISSIVNRRSWAHVE